MTNLAQRALAAGWDWEIGAAGKDPETGLLWRFIGNCKWVEVTTDTLKDTSDLEDADEHPINRVLAAGPDFDDTPTRSLLLEQVRKRWLDPRIYVACIPNFATVYWWHARIHGRPFCAGRTEAHALVAAYEMAEPGKGHEDP